MGSVQRLATVVIVGLVALSTVLFLYLGDEDNRITAKEELQQEAAIERATQNYIGLCLQCHGPAGEGYTEPGAQGTGRIGAPLGGINTSLNQEGINAAGTPISGGVESRAEHIREVITEGLQNPDGSVRMPAFGAESGGPLNPEQVNEMVTLIQEGDWNRVYNEAVEVSGGYPTPPPPAEQQEQDQPIAEPTGQPPSEDGGAAFTVESHDIFFVPDELEIPADTDVTISLPNVGNAPHNFSVPELGIDIDINPGETQETVINAPAGEYEFVCDVPGHREAGMVGTLIVSEGAAAPEADQEAEGDAAAPAADSEDAEAEGGEDADEGAAGAEPVTVESYDIYFEPTEVTIAADTDVPFILPNLGAAPHNFSVDELGIDVDIAPGETQETVINAPAGTYEFWCNVPGHREAGMVGTLIVE